MQSVIKPRAFFEALLAQKKMPLTDALAFFVKKNGKPDIAWAYQFMLQIHNGDVLGVIDNNGVDFVFSEQYLAQPDHYSLIIKDSAALDSRVIGGYLALADAAFPVEDIPPEHHCALQFFPLFRIVGESAGAESLAERVRAFTHFFAYQVSTRKLSIAASLFSSTISTRNTESALQDQLAELESVYGELSYFDRVTLHTIYHGKGRNKKLFREMALPKGVDRDARRGESEFYLVGMHTPSGAMIHAARVSLGIVEEGGLLKIAEINWYIE